MLLSAAMLGVEKNTIESRSAFSTSAAATASTVSAPPIRTSRRCFLVMRISILAFESQILQRIVQRAQPLAGCRRVACRASAMACFALSVWPSTI